MTLITMIKTIMEGVSLAAIIIVSQIYVLPQVGLLSPNVDSVVGAAFATFVVYTGLTLIHRSERNEKP